MEYIRLGKTELQVSRTGFGAIPIQRIGREEAKGILLRAYEAGINYFDTARAYTDSEEKMGYAFSGLRDKIIIASKSMTNSKKQLMEDIDTSLRNLQTDYIDVYQMHNPEEVYPDVYEGMLALKQQGKIRHIGITFHKREKAEAAVKSGMFDTLQFPLTFLSSPEDLALIDLCKKEDMGILAMKGLAGGLINDATCAFTFMRRFENLVPLWGIERMSELEEFISLESNPPLLDQSMQQKIDGFIQALQGNFCRGCGYCLPCSVGIHIPVAARVAQMMSRMAYQEFITEEFQAKIELVKNCTNCGLCKSRCPYGLDIPPILQAQYGQYKELLRKYL